MTATCWLADCQPDVKAFVSRRCDFRQINGDAAELDAGGKALDQPPNHHNDGGQGAECRIARNQGDRYRSDGHKPQREHKSGAASVMVDVGAEENAAERAHQKTGPKRHEGQHELRKLAAGGKERSSDRGRVVTEDEKVVHLQKVSARDADDRPDLLAPVRARHCRHVFLGVAAVISFARLRRAGRRRQRLVPIMHAR